MSKQAQKQEAIEELIIAAGAASRLLFLLDDEVRGMGFRATRIPDRLNKALLGAEILLEDETSESRSAKRLDAPPLTTGNRDNLVELCNCGASLELGDHTVVGTCNKCWDALKRLKQ